FSFPILHHTSFDLLTLAMNLISLIQLLPNQLNPTSFEALLLLFVLVVLQVLNFLYRVHLISPILHPMYFQNQCIQLYAVPVLSILLLMYAVYLFFFYLFYFPFSPILFSLFPFLLFYLSSHCMPSFVPALQYQLLMLFYPHLLVQRILLLYQ